MCLDSIVLMGPLAVGKSSMALNISQKLGLQNYLVDRLKWFYRLKDRN